MVNQSLVMQERETKAQNTLQLTQVMRKRAKSAEKPLHLWPTDFISTALQLPGGARKVFDALLASANSGDDKLAYELAFRLYRYGVSKTFLKKIAGRARQIRVDAYAAPNKVGRFEWKLSFSIGKEFDRAAVYALALVYGINLGLASNVRRCPATKIVKGKAVTCECFFVGATKRKFCSNACANRDHVRAHRDNKRKREKGERDNQRGTA